MQNSIKILYVLHDFNMAGSQKSLLALALEMRKLGHEIMFVGGPGKFETQLKKNMILYRLRIDGRFSPLSMLGLLQLLPIAKSYNPDLIHCSGYWPHIESLFVKSILNIPIITTFAGGPFYGNPIIAQCPIISYSDELRDAILKHHRFPEHAIITVKNRLDFRDILNRKREGRKPTFKRNSCILIGSVRNEKESSILAYFDFINQIHKNNLKVKGNILGGGNIFNTIKQKALTYNTQLGKNIFELIGPTSDVIPHILDNDIAFGLGRSVIEPMALGRPGIVPCIDGVPSLVTAKNANKHAYFNFAGRFSHSPEEKLENDQNIKKLLTDQEYFQEISIFSNKYIVDNYDISKVRAFMNRLYCLEIHKHHQAFDRKQRLALFALCIKKYIVGSLRRTANIGKRASIWCREKRARYFEN